ncbi:hypothetical protein FRY74_07715 [Vicingus serpentipes]|jgi:hypothetical protein|uniref:Outer membrane beta-barrel protein n=1 Tax=Vicingus serpentipes TaxID=1926625 RepID=A0A5C6RSI8_9FLAO|nr:hypothetical protein [Vicingus serpentipes]TXB65301.1 hypothetical protein FRY74_07715 [Vicingus serpentipes]
MKKRLLFVAAIVAASTTFAQDGLTSKKGEAYLPEAGDWSISVDAQPLLNYVGNMANAGTNGAGTLNAAWTNGSNAITGKYFKDENTAYRAMLRIGFSSSTVGTVNNYFVNPSDVEDQEFTDEVKVSGNNVTLGFGLEKRRGNTRIQGVYGAMMNIGFGGGKTTNTYGLAYSDSAFAANPGLVNGRTLETKAGSTFQLGIAGFIGVEWFFAPKVSLGAEYTWGLAMSSTGEGEVTSESWGLNPGEVATNPNHIVTNTAKTGKSSSFGIDTGLSGANISLNFHF